MEASYMILCGLTPFAMRGAGGVGGTLIVSDFVLHTSNFVAMDGTGNVSGLVDSITGKISADYAYSPFGETIQQSGSMAKANPIKFSSKYSDDESGMLYYGYRSLNPSTGRWLSRDPIGEAEQANLYGFVFNNPVNAVDLFGLAGYFFDGTDNDKDRDTWLNLDAKNGPTNVAILFGLYKKEKRYMWGIGTRGSSIGNFFGKIAGFGANYRIEEMMKFLDERMSVGDTDIDIVGFSRGAATAREFANRIKAKYPCARIRWMGLFDTVASFGIPGIDYNWGYNLSIPDNVDSLLHLTSNNDNRIFFPSTSIRKGPTEGTGNPNWRELGLPGSHSDVGGGYRGHTLLARKALKMMYLDGIAHNVPFDPLPPDYDNPEDFGIQSEIHDSRWANDIASQWLLDILYNYRNTRHVFYP